MQRDDRRGVVRVFPVLDFGGIESRAVIQAMSWLPDQALRFCCFAEAGSAAVTIRNLGFAVDELGTPPSVRNPRALWRLWRYLRHHRPLVVHAVSGAMTVHGLLAATLARVPVRIAEEVGIPNRGRVGRIAFPWLYRLATCVIGVSNAVVEFLVERDGVPRSKVRRVYNAIELRYFAPISRSSTELFTILAAGRLAPVKGHADLLAALAPLLRGEKALLRIAGDGPEQERLVALAAELGVSDTVEFLGFRSDLPELMRAADLFVLPSRMEGFGLAVVEAMAAGVPVVATHVGGVPEVVPDWAVDELVGPGDPAAMRAAIERVLDMSEQQRRDIGMQLRDHAVEHFGPERYVRQLQELYAELTAAAGVG